MSMFPGKRLGSSVDSRLVAAMVGRPIMPATNSRDASCGSVKHRTASRNRSNPSSSGIPRRPDRRALHDVSEIGTADPAPAEPGPPAHRVELALALQGADVRAVVDQPDPPSGHLQVVGMEVAADDAVAATLREELDQGRPAAAGAGLARLKRVEEREVLDEKLFTETFGGAGCGAGRLPRRRQPPPSGRYHCNATALLH